MILRPYPYMYHGNNTTMGELAISKKTRGSSTTCGTLRRTKMFRQRWCSGWWRAWLRLSIRCRNGCLRG